MPVDLCIYHGNCADGFGAAWAVRKALGDIEFHSGVYGQEPPDVMGRSVVMVDFSYKRPIIERMAARAKSILILDHHKTAAEDLSDLGHLPNVTVVFDMNRSGARMAWDHYFPDVQPPRLIRYIEDRDLWRFVLPESRQFSANLFSHPYDFAAWDDLAKQAEADEGLALMVAAGEAIERKHHKDIAELVAKTMRRMVIGGINVPVANLPYTLSSDAGNLMARMDESKIGVCYWDEPGGRVFSLRSVADGPDVSAIAKSYGGGGHKNASGFKMPVGWEGDNHAG